MNGVVVTSKLCFVGDVRLAPKPTILDVISLGDIKVVGDNVVDEQPMGRRVQIFGGDLDRKIVVVVVFEDAFVGDETTLYFRIVVGLLQSANPGFVVSESSPYY